MELKWLTSLFVILGIYCNGNSCPTPSMIIKLEPSICSAITSPLHEEVMQAVLCANVMMGNDPDCTNWISRFRVEAENGSNENRSRRSKRRRRR